ncbi:MAG: LacI family DNA-binding transcriptional regulator [Aquabacterium sp.]
MHKPIRSQRAESTGKVTLEMVAAHAGVSPSTVSRILNGTAVVSDEKRAAVDRAVATLGFVPNPVARGLAGGRTLSIGVVTQAIDSPFYGAALRSIEIALGAAGYSPLFMSGHWHAEEEARCIDVLRSRRVDGIIVLTGRLPDGALQATARSLPLVVTGRALSAANLASLDFDHQQGAQLATQHLIDLGHRQVAFIGGPSNHPDAVQRAKGYRSALKSAGLKGDAALVAPGGFTEYSGVQAVDQLVASGAPFSAIFAANDQMALGAALALYRRGLRVPDDVSLVGFDDVASAQYAIPPLTTIHNPVQEIGELAAKAMLALLSGEPVQVEVPLPRLVVRESTRRATAAQPLLRRARRP